MKRLILLSFVLLGALIGPAVAAAEGMTFSISPRIWNAGDITGAGSGPTILMFGGSVSIGHSDSDFSVSASYLTGSNGESITNSQSSLFNYDPAKMINGKYTLADINLNWRVNEYAGLFVGLVQSKWSNDVDFLGKKATEKMSEEYTQPKFGMVYDIPFSDNGRHHAFTSFSISVGTKKQFYSGFAAIGRGTSFDSTGVGIDTHIGYQYSFEDVGALNVRYRYLTSGGGASDLNRNISGFELGGMFRF